MEDLEIVLMQVGVVKKVNRKEGKDVETDQMKIENYEVVKEMEHTKLLLNEIVCTYNNNNSFRKNIDLQLDNERKVFNKKIIVLDDDPTGVQTIHDISVYTDWTGESIELGFMEENPLFFILTNSRSFTVDKTIKVHQEIAKNILKVAKKLSKDFIIISRGDSTLRGHYPIETQVLKETIEENSDIVIDGEIICPYFKEGGRLTIDNVHYVQENNYLVPVGSTEFAKDKTFPYTQSHLGKWIEEKTKGRFKEAQATYISLKSIRKENIEDIVEKLNAVEGFHKIVVNALDYIDIKVFAIALFKAMNERKNFIFRTAASFVKVIGGIEDKELLSEAGIIDKNNSHGGLIIVGSHVKKSTEQLRELERYKNVEFIEFDSNLVLKSKELEEEIVRVARLIEKYIAEGQNVAVYTKRKRLDRDDKEESLKISVRISTAVASIVKRLSIRPNYIIAKGGITSSDVGIKGLGVKKARVKGQIRPGIPVWETGAESKFPGISYIIFPGNVGGKNTLAEIVEKLNQEQIKV